MRPRLRRAYRATIYVVIVAGMARFELRPGRHHPAFDAWLKQQQARQAVLLTAWNPRSRQLEHSRNRAANRELESWIEGHRYQYEQTEHRAEDPAWNEQGFAILDLPPQLATSLAKRWRQNAVLLVRHGRRAALLRTRWNPVDESPKFF